MLNSYFSMVPLASWLFRNLSPVCKWKFKHFIDDWNIWHTLAHQCLKRKLLKPKSERWVYSEENLSVFPRYGCKLTGVFSTGKSWIDRTKFVQRISTLVWCRIQNKYQFFFLFFFTCSIEIGQDHRLVPQDLAFISHHSHFDCSLALPIWI